MKTAENNRHFVSLPFRDGELLSLPNDTHPTAVHGWGHEGRALALDGVGTHYCFVLTGPAKLTVHLRGGPYCIYLQSLMYCACPNPIQIEGGSGIAISRLGFSGLFMAGGPMEPSGRLRYIDGCTDSLIIPPVTKGDPCLNHLHFPKNINQTRHVHPSIRVGVVAEGRGRCVVPDEQDPTRDLTFPLEPGRLFFIPTDGQHSFFTDDSEMDVIAYHPDSDTGPDHDNHPMINRTIVDGLSAAQIDKIRTK